MDNRMEAVQQLCANRGVYILENLHKRRWELVDASREGLGYFAFRLGMDAFLYWVGIRFLRWMYAEEEYDWGCA